MPRPEAGPIRTILAVSTLALVLAGCVTPQAEELDTAAADLAAAPLPPLDVSLDGQFGPGVLVCPAVTCVGTPPTNTQRFFEQDGLRGTVDVNLTATWTATTPLMQSLILGAYACADPCRGDADVRSIEYVVGSSPLSLTASVEVGDDERFFVYMWTTNRLPGGMAGAFVTAPQTFHIEGTLAPQ